MRTKVTRNRKDVCEMGGDRRNGNVPDVAFQDVPGLAFGLMMNLHFTEYNRTVIVKVVAIFRCHLVKWGLENTTIMIILFLGTRYLCMHAQA